MLKINYNPTKYDVILAQGGWDLETPTLALPNGYVRQVQNFEVSQNKGGGYVRCDGYERFDGRTSPSSATFSIIQLDANTFTVGVRTPQTLVATGGGTATLLYVGTNYLVVTNVVPPFGTLGTNIADLSGTVAGMVVAQTVVPSNKETAQFTAYSAEVLRALIQPVPGSGPVRGVAVLPVSNVDTVFAWRDNVGATAEAIYKATTSGWTAVTLYNELTFSAGTTSPNDGDTITQGGVTATIKRVVWETGSWSGGTAAGRFIVTNPAGGNFGAGAATAPGSTFTLAGIQTAISISPGGRYEFEVHNFYGQLSKKRLYGCSGVQKAFEFDGDVYVPLNHNDASRFPLHLCTHKEHLMLGIESSIIHSAPGDPYKINAAAGGSEIALGDKITNFVKQPGNTQGGTLTITTLSNVHTLYGSSALNWELVGQNTGTMGFDYTSGRMSDCYWFDRNGVMSLITSQNFGNFESATLTNNISQFIQEKRGIVVGSAVNRIKSQYRLYFSDASALYCTIVNGRLLGVMPQQLADVFYTIWDGTSTTDATYAGSATGGYVYLLDTGTSFDGDDIDAYMIFNWNPIKSPRVLKRYRHASLELQGGIYAEIQFGFNLSYGRSGVPQDLGRAYELSSTGGAFWDNFAWDNFYWDGAVVAPTECELRGSGENIQVVIRSGTNYIPSYALNSIILHHTPRRGLR